MKYFPIMEQQSPSERNLEMLADWKDGMSTKDLLEKYQITRCRLYQLVKGVKRGPSNFDYNRRTRLEQNR